jgi:hypothetical protein
VSLTACVFKNHTALALDPLRIGVDAVTGETLFSDDRGYTYSVAVEERIGNISAVASLRALLEQVAADESRGIREKILFSGSHGGDFVAGDDVEEIYARATLLSSQAHRFDAVLLEFLGKIIRLCEVSRREGNPIVFI